MTTFDSNDLTNQVLTNCVRSDAAHAGSYSVCGLALRLRDLYKWHHHLKPWVEDNPDKVLDWIGTRETAWDEMEGLPFNHITIGDQNYDPFDSQSVNKVLRPHGLWYGAGYASNLKPTFFLAELDQTTMIEDYPVHILGRERARDLATLPALSQDGQIIVRKDAGQYHFWDQLFFVNPSGRKALDFGLKEAGLNPADMQQLQRQLPQLMALQIDTYIYHELGELNTPLLDGNNWREIISDFVGTPVELVARTVKDLLADTGEHGLLRHIVRKGKTTALAFYVAFIDGMRRKLFPEIRTAFSQFMHTRQWETIQLAIEAGYKTAGNIANSLIEIYAEGKQRKDLVWAQTNITDHLLRPLGVVH